MTVLNRKVIESIFLWEGSNVSRVLELVQRLIDRDFPDANRAEKDVVRTFCDDFTRTFVALLS